MNELGVRYGDVRAVNGVSFTVESGEVLALLGPNGAGKTTTVETLEGYRRPSSGSVRVLGLDPLAEHDALVRRVGVMLQSGGVYPGIRPLEVLKLFASYYDDPDDPALLLDRVGLTHRRTSTWRRLSGGEQQRLSLALALIGRPDVAFLDEPTSGVDVAGRQLIRELIAELRQSGVTVMLTTHDLEEAERMADRIVIIDQGAVVASGTPAELMRSTEDAEIRFGAPPHLDTASLGRALNAFVDPSGAPIVGGLMRGSPSTTYPSRTCAPGGNASKTSFFGSLRSPASIRSSGRSCANESAGRANAHRDHTHGASR